jgi:transcriptional regulator with XRE-family HTH domain
MQIGAQLKEARQKLALSLRALGERCDLSASFLSQVELGQTVPSLGSLQRIATALSLPISALLTNRASDEPVVRRADRDSLRSEWSKSVLESLVPGNADDRFQAMLLRLDPEGRTGVTLYAAGHRMFAYCTAGAAVAILTEPAEEIEIGTGDSLIVNGLRTVAWFNRVSQVTELIVVDARLV